MNASVLAHPCVGGLQMSWAPQPDATIADLAAIELRRIVDVLQIEHASLFLHDPDHPQRAVTAAAVGLPVDEALIEYGGVVARVMHTGRVHEVAHAHGAGRGGCSAMAVPLGDGQRPIGVLLVVTVRETRRLGTFDAQVVVRATETLVSRIVAPERRFHRESAARRAT
jgi:GAF domain-containing protein